MKIVYWIFCAGLLSLAAEGNAYEDRASPEIKRHMLVELYELTEIDHSTANYERHALLPSLQAIDDWGKSEQQCVLQEVHDYLQEPIFDALLEQVPSELIAENVMFFTSDFGHKVNDVVIHGEGLKGLSPSEQELIKKNIAVLTFLQQLSTITNNIIQDSMGPALTPAIAACSAA